MTAMGKVKTHDAIVWLEKSRVGIEVGGRARESYCL
jgi:hypothetical protein